jgi:hypothetical protein
MTLISNASQTFSSTLLHGPVRFGYLIPDIALSALGGVKVSLRVRFDGFIGLKRI